MIGYHIPRADTSNDGIGSLPPPVPKTLSTDELEPVHHNEPFSDQRFRHRPLDGLRRG